MDATQRNYMPMEAAIDDKANFIREHLREFLPTIVLSMPEGIYIFSDKLESVYSTIVVAGAGRSFSPIANWFRGEMYEFANTWSRMDPEAKIDSKILEGILASNLDVKNGLVLADLVIVEIGKERGDDYIARIDFFGKTEELKNGHFFVMSYKNIQGDTERYVPHEDGELEQVEDGEEFAGAESNGSKDEHWDRITEEFSDMDISAPEITSEDEGVADKEVAIFLEELKSRYPGKKCFLSREKINGGQFDRVFQNI